MKASEIHPTPVELRDAMRADHERMDALTEHLIARVRDGDYEEIAAAWNVFEHDFLAHLADEERELLPLFDRVEPHAAAQVRADHAHLRLLLERIGMEIELHALRETTVIELVHRLRKHATREEHTLYAWADAQLVPPARTSILDRLRAALGRAQARKAG
jgi:hypothetical protein